MQVSAWRINAQPNHQDHDYHDMLGMKCITDVLALSMTAKMVWKLASW